MTDPTGKRPTILGLGTVALDTVETPAERVDEVPGGSAPYFGAAARRWGRVSLVGVAGEDLPADALAPLVRAGVDVSGIRRVPGETFRWHVRYDAQGARTPVESRRCVRGEGTLDVPSWARDPDALFLGSTDPADQRAILEAAGRPGLVALDTMGHWIRDRREELVALLGRVDVLLLNEEELRLLGGEGSEGAAARAVRASGARWVVVKRGARGAAAYAEEGMPGWDHLAADIPGVPVPEVVDPTGAGDAFAGGLVGRLALAGGRGALDSRVMADALADGALMGARAVRSFSYDALLGEEGEE